MSTPADDYSEQSFFFPEFIAAMAPLDERSAMEYFTFSPWYRTEPPSNNQILRMQNVGNENGAEMNEREELKKFTGLEFAVVHSEPPSLFILHKRERLSPDEVRPLEVYYLINNRIQQSPNLYALIANRMNASLHALMSSMSILRQHKPAFTPKKGHVWPVSFDPTSAFVTSSSKKLVSAAGAEDGISHAAGTPLDTGTPGPAGSVTRGGSVQPSARAQMGDASSSTNVVTLPLLHAIRTTAVHILAALPPARPPTSTGLALSDADTPSRKIRNVMEIAHSMDSPSLVSASPTSPLNPQQQRFIGINSIHFSNTVSPYIRTEPGSGGSGEMLKASTPRTQESTPNRSDPGTPGWPERRRKKKRTVGSGGTPIAVQSPPLGVSPPA